MQRWAEAHRCRDIPGQDLKYCRGGKNHAGKPRAYGKHWNVRRMWKRRFAGPDRRDRYDRFTGSRSGVPVRPRRGADPDGTVHAAHWKEMFDGYLRERAARTEEEFVPFDLVADYELLED